MQGFIQRRVPLLVRRGVTMLPALVVLTLGLPATQVLSNQVTHATQLDTNDHPAEPVAHIDSAR